MKEARRSQENAKRRRKSVVKRQGMTCNENNCPKAKDDLKVQQEKMEIVSCMDEKGKASNSEETKKLTTDGPQTSICTTLMANNRALAAALEEAQLELRSVNLENMQLRRKIHEDHQQFVEKTRELEKQLRHLDQVTGNHVPKSAQVVFHDVYKLLSQTCAQFLQGSNFLSDALHLVNSILTPASGTGAFQSVTPHEYPHVLLNNVSYVDPVVNAACTTPPPDEPSAMEITAPESVILETNDATMNPLDTELEHISTDTSPMDINQSQISGRRAKRKSCVGVSYTEPNLNSKLRRGDRFTDTTLYGDESLTNTRKKKKAQTKRVTSIPILGRSKKRAPLSDLTNVITEECSVCM